MISRINSLELIPTLDTRRLRGDQIGVFKISNGHENIDPNICFKIKTGKRTRGHDLTLVKGQNRLDVRKYSFSQRTVNEWNKLPADCVHSSSINMFKNKIDNYVVDSYMWTLDKPTASLSTAS